MVNEIEVPKGCVSILRDVVIATRKGDPEFIGNTKSAQKLIEAGFVVLDGDSDIHGNLPLKSTQLGYDWYEAKYLNSENEEKMTEQETTQEQSTEFAVFTGPLVKGIRKSTARAAKYPFDDMNEPVQNEDGSYNYAQFFVPVDLEDEKTKRVLNGAVANANRRYSTVVDEEEYQTKTGDTRKRYVYEYERRFISKTVEHDGVMGVLILRVDNTLD